MKKTFDQIDREIRKTFVYENYYDFIDIEKILSKIVGKNVSMYDNKIDDGIDNDSDDSYVMCDCFSTDDDSITIHIYYGDRTGIVGCVDVSTTA